MPIGKMSGRESAMKQQLVDKFQQIYGDGAVTREFDS